MPTLRAYLDHAAHKARTVQALRVQRRTLYAWRPRIEAILGRDLDTQDTPTRLTLAIQAPDLLADRDSGIGTVYTNLSTLRFWQRQQDESPGCPRPPRRGTHRAQNGSPTVIIRKGEPAAAVVPIEDFNVLEDAIDCYFSREAD